MDGEMDRMGRRRSRASGFGDLLSTVPGEGNQADDSRIRDGGTKWRQDGVDNVEREGGKQVGVTGQRDRQDDGRVSMQETASSGEQLQGGPMTNRRRCRAEWCCLVE